MRLIDTNVFLRYILDDLPHQSAACRALFTAIAEERLVAWTTDIAIAEAVFVLTGPRTYAFARQHVRDALLPLIELPHLKIARKRLYRGSLSSSSSCRSTFPMRFTPRW